MLADDDNNCDLDHTHTHSTKQIKDTKQIYKTSSTTDCTIMNENNKQMETKTFVEKTFVTCCCWNTLVGKQNKKQSNLIQKN